MLTVLLALFWFTPMIKSASNQSNNTTAQAPAKKEGQSSPKQNLKTNTSSPKNDPLSTATFCWKPRYGRGIGTIPKECPPGKELKNLLCRNHCKANHTGVGFLCWKNCDPGYKNDGLTCRRPKPLHIYGRTAYNRGVGTIRVCGEGLENKAGLCYKKCKPGYVGVGPVCWGQCGGSLPHNCGASCAVNRAACFTGVLDMAASTLELIGNIGMLALTAGAYAGVSVGTKAAMEGADAAFDGAVKIAKISSTIPAEEINIVRKQVVTKIKEAGKDMTDKLADEMTDRLVESGMNGFQMDWTTFDPTGISGVVKAFAKPSCGLAA